MYKIKIKQLYDESGIPLLCRVCLIHLEACNNNIQIGYRNQIHSVNCNRCHHLNVLGGSWDYKIIELEFVEIYI